MSDPKPRTFGDATGLPSVGRDWSRDKFRPGEIVRLQHEGRVHHATVLETARGRPPKSGDPLDRLVTVKLANGKKLKRPKRDLTLTELPTPPAPTLIVDLDEIGEAWAMAPGPSWLEYFSVDNEDENGQLPHERSELFPRKHPGIRRVVEMERRLIERYGR